MKALSDYTPAELARKLAQAAAATSALNDELIAAGRGFEKLRDTVAKGRAGADELSVRYAKASGLEAELRGEEARRLAYHGSTRRIRKM